MWTCKHCGQEVESNLHECWNCGTGINWSPPPEPVLASAEEEISPESKAPPFSEGATGLLRIIAFAVGIVGALAGIVILINAPKGPSDIALEFHGDDLPTQIQSANRMLFLVAGWAQIVGGIAMGVFLYVVAGMGDMVCSAPLK